MDTTIHQALHHLLMFFRVHILSDHEEFFNDGSDRLNIYTARIHESIQILPLCTDMRTAICNDANQS